MAKLTAFILIGSTKQKQSDFIPSHYITLYESDHPSLSLYKFDKNKEIIRIKPPADKLVDNIYFLILTFVLNAEINSTDFMKILSKWFWSYNARISQGIQLPNRKRRIFRILG